MDDITPVEMLKILGGNVSAVELCNALTLTKIPRKRAQAAISRAIDAGEITLESDWTLKAYQG